MTIKLYDPDAVLRQTWYPGTVHTPSYKYYNLNDYFNSTGKLAGQWHMRWDGYNDGAPDGGDAYMNVGMKQVLKSTAIGTTFNSNQKLAAGLYVPTQDGKGAVITVALMLNNMEGSTPRKDIRTQVKVFYEDLKSSGGSSYQNGVREIYIYIQKVAFGGYGTTGTGTGGSWYNSGIDISRLDMWGNNVTITGGSTGVEKWVLNAATAGIVRLAVWAATPYLATPLAPLAIVTIMSLLFIQTAPSSNPDQAYYKTTDTSAGAGYTHNSDYLYNASGIANKTLFSFDSSKSLSYAFKIWGRVVYWNSNPPATLLDKITPAVYLVVKNA
jgi:hypothetical protein